MAQGMRPGAFPGRAGAMGKGVCLGKLQGGGVQWTKELLRFIPVGAGLIVCAQNPYLHVQPAFSAQPLQQYFFPSLGLVNPFPANAFQSFLSMLHLGQVSSAIGNPPFPANILTSQVQPVMRKLDSLK
jgi:hypothetical protein